jgi:putative aldouronate transport system substrate-binding protein
VRLPTYVALPNLPPPDLPGTSDGLLAPGYQNYPSNLIRSVPQPPGKGGEVNALTVSLSPPPTPLESNAAWQQVNKEVGVTLNIPSVSSADYPARLNTVLAGGDLPDIVAVSILSTTMPNIGDFLNNSCADLTPYLSGEAVKDYPNLANLPSTAWSPMIYNNKIMAVPIAAGGVRASPSLLARGGDLDKQGITSIGSPDQFMGICKQLNNPGTRWALGANTMINWLAMAYGARTVGPKPVGGSPGTLRHLSTRKRSRTTAHCGTLACFIPTPRRCPAVRRPRCSTAASSSFRRTRAGH